MLRLITWINELAAKTWPDNRAVRYLRTLFSKTASRVIVGVVVGLAIGSLSAIVGICLSGLDVSNAATFNQMMSLVVSFAVVWAVILACFCDFTYLYLRFLRYQETRWAQRRVLGKYRKSWEDEMDGLPPMLSSTGKPANPD
jgi:hypothetical protein